MRPLLALAVLAPFVSPSPAAACSCMARTVQEEIASADAIFEGIVDSIDEADGVRVVRIAVTQAWRGVTTERVELTTAANDAACGYPFEVGTAYLVYASNDGGLAVSLCSRTQPMDGADEDRRALGSGVVPVDVVDEPVEPVRPPRTSTPAGGCTVGRTHARASLALLALASIATLARRRTRA